MGNIAYKTPFISVKFTSPNGESVVMTNMDFGGDITALNTVKGIRDAFGTFTITMICRKNYSNFFLGLQAFTNEFLDKKNPYQIFGAMTLVQITINNYGVMVGIVDAITRRMISQDGKPKITLTIVGRDLGAFLVDHKMWYDNRFAHGREYNSSMLGGVTAFGAISGSPAKIMQQFLNTYFIKILNTPLEGTVEPFQFSDGRKIQDVFVAMSEAVSSYYVVSDRAIPGTGIFPGSTIASAEGPGCLSEFTYGDYYPIQFSVWNFQGELLHLLQSLTQFPFNELYVETGGAPIVLGAVRESFGGVSWLPAKSMQSRNATFGVENSKVIPMTADVNGVRRQGTLPERAYLVLRPTPYDDANLGIEPTEGIFSLLSMQDLNGYKVDDSQILEKSLTMGRNNKPTFYSVYPANQLLAGQSGVVYTTPIYDKTALRKYGYNPLEVQLSAFNINASAIRTSKDDKGMVDLCKLFQRKLFSWYQHSDKLLNGSFRIGGRPEIRIGNRLEYGRTSSGEIENEYEEGYYYTTRVQHDYIYAQNFITTVGVERGRAQKMPAFSTNIAVELPVGFA
jgi:hypothetical protein